MKFRKLSFFPLLVLGLSTLLFACQSGDNRVLGSIDGKSYTVDGLLSLFLNPDAMKEARKNFTDEDLSSGFEHLAAFVVFAGEADKTHFFENDTDAKQKLESQTKRIYQSAYQKYINDTILTPMLDKITATDADLAPYKKRVQVRHILLSKDGSMKDPAKGKELQQQILQELDKGANFSDLAKKYSEDPGSKDSGGLIPEWIYENSPFVPEFKNAALGATKNHQIISDVNSEYGTHIIYIESLQDRSSSEIKKNDSQLYNQILEENKNKKRQDFAEELLKEFPVEVNKNLDFKKYFSTYTKSKGMETLYTINKTISYTGANFIEDVLQGDENKLKGIFKQNPNLDMAQVVKMLGVMPIVEELYAKKKGIDKEEKFQKTLYIPLLSLKANLYMEALLKKEGPKKEATPHFTVSDQEVEKFYNEHKEFFTKTPEKGKEPVVTPLNDSLKEDIRSKVLTDKTQQFQQNESKKILDFIQQKAENLYGEYKIVVNKDFIQKKDPSPAANAEK